MTHPDGIWHEFRPIGTAYFLDTRTGERIEFGTVHFAPIRRWRKRAFSLRSIKKVRYRRKIKRKVRTATLTMEGISRETVALFLGIDPPLDIQAGDVICIDGVPA